MTKKTSRAKRDGWEDGFAGVSDMSCCAYKANDTRAAYEEGRKQGYALKLRIPESIECPKRQAELQRLVGRTIVKAEGSSLFEASFTLTLDDGYVVEVGASGDDAARVTLNGT